MSNLVEPQPVWHGKRWTRAEWEKAHRPICHVHPCYQWMEIHWHLSEEEQKYVGSRGPRRNKRGEK